MKYAAHGGLGLVLCEESADETPSVWDFATDTLLALDHQPEGGRQIVVRKHRYGASATGKRPFEIDGWRQPHVRPRPDVWLGGQRSRSTLQNHGWEFSNGDEYPLLRWIDTPEPNQGPRAYRCSFAVIAGHNLEHARRLAFGLVPGAGSGKDVLIELDPLGLAPSGWSSKSVAARRLPISGGVNAAICELIEYLGAQLFGKDDAERPRRVIIGDLRAVAPFGDSASWAEGINVIAALVAESGCGIPVIAYESHSPFEPGGSAARRWRADLIVEVSDADERSWHATSRPDGTFDKLVWSGEALDRQWPEEIAHLAEFPLRRKHH